MDEYTIDDAIEDTYALEHGDLTADERVMALERIRLLLAEVEQAAVLIEEA